MCGKHATLKFPNILAAKCKNFDHPKRQQCGTSDTGLGSAMPKLPS
jgi:hypothetical protein